MKKLKYKTFKNLKAFEKWSEKEMVGIKKIEPILMGFNFLKFRFTYGIFITYYSMK